MARSFGDQSSIFLDETVLYDSWTPERLPERESELDRIHDALAPAARGAAPHNAFIYGKTGQGKTVAVQHKLEELDAFAEETDALDLNTVWYSCAKDNTSYQVVSNLVQQLTGSKPRGYDMRTVFDLFYDELQSRGGTVIIVLDEIDSIGTESEILYELPRARANGHIENMWVSVIGISNDFDFRDSLSPKIKDTLCDEEIHFSPYDAQQLRSILLRRADQAFHDGALDEDVIPLCSALAAQDKGSARQSIRYLYKAGELASKAGEEQVSEEHVREAEEIIQRRSIEKGIRDLTIQDHLALLAVLSLDIEAQTPARTREVYGRYTEIADTLGVDQLVMRRVRDHLQDLDLAGIVKSRMRKTGTKGGRHYVFELDSDPELVLDVLAEVDRLSEALDRFEF